MAQSLLMRPSPFQHQSDRDTPRSHASRGAPRAAAQAFAPQQQQQQAGTWQQQKRRAPLQQRNELAGTPALPSLVCSSEELRRQSAVLQSLSQWAEATLPQYMSSNQQQQWQPSLLLPDMSLPVGVQQLTELREEAEKLPTDVLVLLAGLAVSAALVPAQLSTSWAGAPGMRDHSGADTHVWARWRREWAADMNRIRAALSSYCYCCGVLDSRAVDVSSHLVISAPLWAGSSSCFAHSTHAAGSSSSSAVGPQQAAESAAAAAASAASAAAAAGVVGLPYQQLFKELLQARMLRVMHDNLSSLASYHGAPLLSNLSAAAAVDLKRHELGLLAACCELAKKDPRGAVLSLATVVRGGVMLACANMDDGWHAEGNAGNATAAAAAAAAAGSSGSSSGGSSGGSNGGSSGLYQDWMCVADCVGAWGVSDTAAAVQDICSVMQVQNLVQSQSASPQAAAAGSFLLAYPGQLRRLAEVQLEGRLRDRRRGRTRSAAFSWVFGRDVLLA